MKVNGNLEVLGVSNIKIPILEEYNSDPESVGKLFIDEYGNLSYDLGQEIKTVRIVQENENVYIPELSEYIFDSEDAGLIFRLDGDLYINNGEDIINLTKEAEIFIPVKEDVVFSEESSGEIFLNENGILSYNNGNEIVEITDTIGYLKSIENYTFDEEELGKIFLNENGNIAYNDGNEVLEIDANIDNKIKHFIGEYDSSNNTGMLNSDFTFNPTALNNYITAHEIDTIPPFNGNSNLYDVIEYLLSKIIELQNS
jgi:hypothetical protein